MSAIPIAAFVLVSLALQVSVIQDLSLAGLQPDLVLVAVGAVAFSARGGSRPGLAGGWRASGTAWIAGLLYDSVSLGPAGLTSLLYLAATAWILSIRKVLARDRLVAQGVVFWVAAILVEAGRVGFLSLGAANLPLGASLLRAGAIALVDAALGVALLQSISLARRWRDRTI